MLRHGTLARIALLSALAVGGSGCYFDLNFDDDSSWTTADDFDYYGGDEFDVLGANIKGDLGTVEDMQDGVWSQRGTALSGFSMVEVQSSGSGWAAMTQLELQGNFSDPAFAPGAVLVFDESGYGPDGLEASVVGCSGQTPGAWDYDQHANTVTLEISESIRAGYLHIEMTTEFEHEGDTQSCTTNFDVAQ